MRCGKRNCKQSSRGISPRIGRMLRYWWRLHISTRPCRCEHGCLCDCHRCQMSGEGLRLNQLPVGSEARIMEIVPHHQGLSKLSELGLTPGTLVSVRKKAPFGGPIIVCVREVLLALRLSEAVHIIVSESPNKK